MSQLVQTQGYPEPPFLVFVRWCEPRGAAGGWYDAAAMTAWAQAGEVRS